MYKNIGERIQKIREYFHLKQGEFSKILGQSQANISRIEAGTLEPSEPMIYAIMAKFAVNPHWIKTGEGEMLVSPENYLKNGIELLGREKMAEGMTSLLESAEYGDLKALVDLNGMAESGVAEEIAVYLRYIVNTWNQGDEKTRHWLEKQLEMGFRDVKKEP